MNSQMEAIFIACGDIRCTAGNPGGTTAAGVRLMVLLSTCAALGPGRTAVCARFSPVFGPATRGVARGGRGVSGGLSVAGGSTTCATPDGLSGT